MYLNIQIIKYFITSMRKRKVKSMKDFLKLAENEVGIECRFATYVRPPEVEQPDMHLVKEQVHMKDGTIVPRIKPIYNYERPYWVVNKGSRNFQQPKEWIDESRTNIFHSTQSELQWRCANSLQDRSFHVSMKSLIAKNPYLFGVDIKSTAVIKQDYHTAYKDLKTEYSVGVFDTETDVIHGTEQITMATFSYGSICFTAVQKSFLKGIANPEREIEEKTKLYLDKYVNERKIKTKLVVCDSEIDVLIETFKVIHAAMPDFLAIWNMKFDMGKIEEACIRAQYPIEHLMSDPAVPNEYRSYEFILGPNKKKTASGLVMPIKPSAQWHTVKCPASFYVIDAMCVYKHTRMGEQEKKSYSLDFILGDELNLGKLKFEIANHLSGLAWHKFMQEFYPVEYVVYNRFDCIGMELLEEKVKDMKIVLPQFSGTSDFEDFKSQPRRKMDSLHWFVQTHGKVMGCTSKALIDEELDPMILDRNDWIITLAPSLVTKQGLQIIEENPSQITSIYGHVGDLDVAASYPNGETCFNISKETTVRELSSVEGISEDVFRKQNMGVSAGHVNAIEYCTTMMGFPTLFELDEMKWD